MRISHLWIGMVTALLASQSWGQSPSSADQIFPVLEDSIYQVKIIEEKSGSQAALGTGFLLDSQLVATNYHVVSNEVLESEKYRVEVEIDEISRELEVVAVDVVSDLAILAPVDFLLEGKPFELSNEAPRRGEILYSLGNPHNLGMTVVQGNYNGLVEDKFLQRVHFSGAINSGMSGGPTVNNRSQVVGVNVASAGNQIGFLVPVEKLELLKQEAESAPGARDLLAEMAQDIGDTTDAMVDAMLSVKWPTEPMGKAKILGKTVRWMECWGNSEEDTEIGVLEIARGCNNGDNIYIESRFNSGFFEYEFYYIEAPEWPTAAFYRLLANSTSGARGGNRANKEQVGNYKCQDKVVHNPELGIEDSMRRRASYCVRAYDKLPGLYDVFFIGVSTDKADHAIMDHFTLSGVRQSAAQRFLDRFIRVLAWDDNTVAER